MKPIGWAPSRFDPAGEACGCLAVHVLRLLRPNTRVSWEVKREQRKNQITIVTNGSGKPT